MARTRKRLLRNAWKVAWSIRDDETRPDEARERCADRLNEAFAKLNSDGQTHDEITRIFSLPLEAAEPTDEEVEISDAAADFVQRLIEIELEMALEQHPERTGEPVALRPDPEPAVFNPEFLSLKFGKFVVILTEGGKHSLVIGRSGDRDFHVQIANQHHASAGGKRGKMWAVGGGGICMFPDSKTFRFAGRSGFGPFDHRIVARLARRAMANEGFADWNIEVIPSIVELPVTNRDE